MDKALRASDELEKALQKRIESVYGDALKQAVKSCERFLRKIRDVDEGKIKPPSYYDTPEKVLKWRRGFTRELLRRENVVKNIEKAIQQAGVEVEPIMRETVANVYHVNRLYTAELVDQQAGVNLSYSVPTTAQAEIILKDSQPPMSKIAYQNLREAPAMMRRLQNEMTQAVMLGEEQKKLIHRIRNVMGNSAYCAKRIAQTERNRVQSQARSDTIREAAEAGVVMHKRWSTRMVNSRDSHVALNGVEIPEGEKFHTVWGNDLAYPGDPDAPAREVINCHCVLVPVVLPPEERS
nr:MAG TPA: minor capsid protein [Caudoviricetes sp.]